MNKKKIIKYSIAIFAFALGFYLAFLSWWILIPRFDFQDNLDYAYSNEDIH